MTPFTPNPDCPVGRERGNHDPATQGCICRIVKKRKRRVSPHRGPSKDGKVQVAVMLTTEERDAFAEVADAECRSITQHLRWLVRQAIEERHDQ